MSIDVLRANGDFANFRANGSGNLNEFQLGEWRLMYSPVQKIFPEEAIFQARGLLNKWNVFFPDENTWVRNNIGVPSLLTRIDSIILPNGILMPFEIEDRPMGVGINAIANPTFRQNLIQVMQTWPKFDVVVSHRRRGTDDYLWANKITLDEALDSDRLVYVRAEPQETEFHTLEPRSVSTVSREGDKGYGIAMGLWDHAQSAADLPWDIPFVIKPLQGSKCKDICVWYPKQRGAATRSQIDRTLASQEGRGMYVQPFYAPMATEIDGLPKWMIHRVYFGFNTVSRTWDCLGGAWMARNNVIIHGASDSVSGPLIPEK